MSYRPHWWIPRVIGTDELRARLATFELAEKLGVRTESSANGERSFVSLEGLGTLSFSRSERSEVCELPVLEEVESALIASSPSAAQALADAGLGEDAPVFGAYVTALGSEPRSGDLLLGVTGPWLLSIRAEGGNGYVPLLDWASWEGRTPPPDSAWPWDAGVRRIRLDAGAGLACGGPTVAFAREADGWRELHTGVTERADFCDVIRHGDDVWLVSMSGDVWRSRDGRATKVLSGDAASIGRDEFRFDLRPFGDGLAIANGARAIHLWDGEHLSAVTPPGLEGDGEVLRWLASPDRGELWAASETRLLVGDGRQWFEPPLPRERELSINGLCADPAGGVWITGTSGSTFVILRATVAGGVQRVDAPALTGHRAFVLADPSAHRGGIVATAMDQWLRYSPASVGTDVSMTIDADPMDRRLEALFPAIDELVASWGGWSGD